MNNAYMNIMTSRSLRFFLFLVLVYFSQVSPFYHIHHFHEDGSLEFEISSHPSEVDVQHSSEHHHDQDIPHTNDHQHTYDNQIDWNIARTQSQRTLLFDNKYIFSSLTIHLTDDDNTTYCNSLKPPFIDNYVDSPLIIRGPPFLV